MEKINPLNTTNIKLIDTKLLLVVISIVLVFISGLQIAQAATFSLSPSTGTFVVGSTFDVSVYLDTEGDIVNVLDVVIKFPPDKLQIVSPEAEQSIISIWTSPPNFDNQSGIVRLQGAVPGGVNTSRGLVFTLRFRVKGVGTAIVTFLDDSKVFLHDGKGTDILANTAGGVYRFALPPPLGPAVASETHPNQNEWYAARTAVLTWTSPEPVSGYSYVLNDVPVDIPDDISEGARESVTYQNLESGTHYFHIKAFRDGSWGGTTHFAVNVDADPPAHFSIDVSPRAYTSSRGLVFNFFTTDAHSGLSHYELKTVPLNPGESAGGIPQNFFIEVQSPYVTSLPVGKYDVIIRAYDRAGNFRESVKRIQIVPPFVSFTPEGVVLGGSAVVSRPVFFSMGALFVALLAALAWRVRVWHRNVHQKQILRELPDDIKEKLEELSRYKKKYGASALLMFFAFSAVLFSVFRAAPASAGTVLPSPPYISTVSRIISNEEIFYLGGKTDISDAEVVIYLQNLQTGETLTERTRSNKKGDWFYRHPTFLPTGEYLLWAQTEVGGQLSPPTPQVTMSVRPTAIQFGASRLSYDFIYLMLIIILTLAVAVLIGYIAYHYYHGKKKRAEFLKEVREAEEAVRRGFAVVARDIERELAFVRKAKAEGRFGAEEERQEAELLKDLERARRHIGKEVMDLEKYL